MSRVIYSSASNSAELQRHRERPASGRPSVRPASGVNNLHTFSTSPKPPDRFRSNLMWSYLGWVPVKFVQILMIHQFLPFWQNISVFAHAKWMGEILHWFIMVKRILDFFSECASPIDFKFGLEFPWDKVLKVCSGKGMGAIWKILLYWNWLVD